MRASLYLKLAERGIPPPPPPATLVHYLLVYVCGRGKGSYTPWESSRTPAAEFAKWPTKRFVMDALAARIET